MSRTVKKKKTGSKAVAPSCGNNKGCGYCLGNKMHRHKRKETRGEPKLRTLPKGNPDSLDY